MDKHILELTCVCPAAESLDEHLRSACHRTEMDVVTALDNLDGFVRADKLDCIVHLFIMIMINFALRSYKICFTIRL
jgi:hypothetical protein